MVALDHREIRTDTETIGELRRVSKSYTTDGGREYEVLDQIDLAVNEGELLALLGQSGSGKSTILRCMTGLIKPTAGRVLCYGKPLDGTINPYASIVFQTFALYPWLTVEQNVAVGLMAKRLSRSEKKEAIERVIELIFLSHYHRSYPRELSGGMRQRVGLARALVSEPKMLCLDEAFSALDVLTAETLRHEIIALWQKQVANLKSIFMVTHNIEEAVEMATRICILFPRPGRLGLVLENKLSYPRRCQVARIPTHGGHHPRDDHDPYPSRSAAGAASRAWAACFPCPRAHRIHSGRHCRSDYWINIHSL
jgi:NitT/TauT family transport system ATP-binding protein